MTLLRADLLCLASAIVPYRDEALAQMFKVPMNADGFFVEAHAKLGPSEFATDGVFLCGMSHYPKPIDESIAQALAAASRAVTLLARGTVRMSGTVAQTDPRLCSELRGVPGHLPLFRAAGSGKKPPLPAELRSTRHCARDAGLCVASCRSGALQSEGFRGEPNFGHD